MSLSHRQLSALQKAGQAVHTVSESIASAVRERAQSMVSHLADQPFAPESEQALGQFRQLAQLSQQLIAVELQMQELYATANDLARPESDVVISLPAHAEPATVVEGIVEDVVAKPAATGKRKPARAPIGKKSTQTPKINNEEKLRQFLKGALNTQKATALTTASMAQGAAMPLGSVTAALKKLLAAGVIVQGPQQQLRWVA